MSERNSTALPGTPLLQSFPALFKNRNFILLWLGYVVAALGDRIHAMVMLQLLQNTKQTELLKHAATLAEISRAKNFSVATQENSQLTIMMLLPFMVLGNFTGILADRLPRRLLMVGSDAARFVIVLVVRTVFLGLQSRFTFDQAIAVLFCSEFALASFGTIFSPARSSLLPNLVHPNQLLRANSMTNAAGTIASLVGFVIGGALVGWDPRVHRVLYIDAVVFLVSGLLILSMRLPPDRLMARRHERRASFFQNFKDGVAYIRSHRRIIQVISLMFLFWSCGTIILNGLTGIITNFFGMKLEYYAYFMGLVGIGMVFGAASVSLAKSGIPKEIGIGWSFVAVGGFLLAFSRIRPHWHVAAVLLLMGAAFFGAVLLVSLETLLQRIVPDFVRGRVMGVKDVINTFGLISVAVPLALNPHIDSQIRTVLMYLSVLVVGVGCALLILYYRHQTLPLPVAITRRIVAAYVGLWQGYRRETACTVPSAGPVIVVSNHTSSLDPFVMQVSSPRRMIHFMMAKEYFELPVLHRAFKLLGCIPVNRSGTDIASIRAAVRTLGEGKALGMFPEGKITLDGKLQEGQLGVAALVLMTGATVVPAYITNSRVHQSVGRDIKGHGKMTIRYGRPMDFSAYKGTARDKVVMQEITDRIMGSIERLRDKVSGANALSPALRGGVALSNAE